MKSVLITILGLGAVAMAATGPSIPSCAADCVKGLFSAAGCDDNDWKCLCSEKGVGALRGQLPPCAQKCTNPTDANNVIEGVQNQCSGGAAGAGTSSNSGSSSNAGSSSSSASASSGSGSSPSATSTGAASKSSGSSTASASASSTNAANSLVGQGMGVMVAAAGLAVILA